MCDQLGGRIGGLRDALLQRARYSAVEHSPPFTEQGPVRGILTRACLNRNCDGVPPRKTNPLPISWWSAVVRSAAASLEMAVNSSCENSRPMAAPTCAVSLVAGSSRSSRAISEACSVTGTVIPAAEPASVCPAASPVSDFEHRLGELLDEKRHSVGPLDNLGHDGFGQVSAPTDPPDQHGRVALAETLQGQHRDVGAADPWRLEFRTKRYQQQNGRRTTCSTIISRSSCVLGSTQWASSNVMSRGWRAKRSSCRSSASKVRTRRRGGLTDNGE